MGEGFGDAGRGSAGVIERERFMMCSRERRGGTPYSGQRAREVWGFWRVGVHRQRLRKGRQMM